MGLGVELITELVSQTRNEVANPGLNGLGGVLVGVAFGAGLFALAMQMHQWSRRVRKRLLIGNTVAGLSLVMVVSNVLEHYRSLEVQPSAPASAAPATKPGSPQDNDTDTSLFKPGWYGELQEEGVVIVVSSFAENARESRQFNLRLSKPVSYATFTLINLNSPGPVVLPSLQVAFVLDSGETVDSLEVRPLLFQRASQNDDLLKRLAEPMTVALGGVAADIPICQAAGFKWERVRNVRVTVNARAHFVTGRVMTADEKRAMLEKPAARTSAAHTNRNDHEWYKGL